MMMMISEAQVSNW